MEKEFRKYSCVRVVKARPMGAEEAFHCGADNLTIEKARNFLAVDGYLVDFPEGYRAWFSAKEFDKKFSLSETYVDRMAIELSGLGKRICSATEALYMPGKAVMTEQEREMLHVQLRSMNGYFQVLLERYRLENRKHVAEVLFEDDKTENQKGGSNGTMV